MEEAQVGVESDVVDHGGDVFSQQGITEAQEGIDRIGRRKVGSSAEGELFWQQHLPCAKVVAVGLPI